MTNRTFHFIVSTQLIIILSMLLVISAGDHILAYLAEQPQSNTTTLETTNHALLD